MPSLNQVILPHPLESLPEDEVRQIARDHFEVVVSHLVHPTD